jgi:type I restriction enzyme S subunit
MSNKAAPKTMTQGSKRELRPALRFPEFRDAPEWTEKPLEEILSPIVRERKKPAEAYTGLGMRSHGKGTFLKNLENPEKNSMEYLYEVQCDDLIVNITFAWEGAIAIAKPTDAGALVSHRFPTFLFKRDAAIPDFFRYIILDKQFVYSLGVISPGGAGRNRVLNKNDFLKLRVFLPEVSEQQKIADCLTNLDEMIVAHGQKLDALKTFRIGLMQQLFPREGETVPRFRFPEFQDAGEWDIKPLIEVAPLQRGFDLPSDEIRPGNVPIVYSNGAKGTHERGMAKGPGIVTGRSGTIGKIHFIERGDYWPHNTSLWVTSFEGHFPKFVYYLYELIGIERFASGSGVPTLNRNDVHCFSAAVSSNIQEQQRIADCLSSLDELIGALIVKLDALKTHKKGLMQKLFPSPLKVEA